MRKLSVVKLLLSVLGEVVTWSDHWSGGWVHSEDSLSRVSLNNWPDDLLLIAQPPAGAATVLGSRNSRGKIGLSCLSKWG